MKKLFIAFFVSLLMVVAVRAQTTWKIDQTHSAVSFSVSHMVIAEVPGRFTEFDATLLQMKDDFSDSKLNATIKVKSINTDNEGRDKHLRSTDFFDAEKDSIITFIGKTFNKIGKDTYKITGDLTIRGTAKPVVLETKFKGMINDPWGNTRVGFKAEGKINRKDFGIVWNKTLEAGGLLVGEEVRIVINVEMVKEKK